MTILTRLGIVCDRGGEAMTRVYADAMALGDANGRVSRDCGLDFKNNLDKRTA